jgi:F420-0:gamma-glutamyl ligase
VVIRIRGGNLPTAVIDLSATYGGNAVALPWDCRGSATAVKRLRTFV